MTLSEICSNILDYFRQEIRKGGELEEMFEWFCDEEGHDINDKRSKVTYIERLMSNFRDNMTMIPQWNGSYSLAQEIQDEYDMAVESLEEYSVDIEEDIDEQDYCDTLANVLSDRLDNPWQNTYNYEWEPITMALDAIGFKNETSLNKIEGATNGQMFVMAYYILGTDGTLPLAWASYCVC
jgi:hypothetical protein